MGEEKKALIYDFSPISIIFSVAFIRTYLLFAVKLNAFINHILHNSNLLGSQLVQFL